MKLVIIEFFTLKKNYKSLHPTVKSTTKLYFLHCDIYTFKILWRMATQQLCWAAWELKPHLLKPNSETHGKLHLLSNL